MKRFTLKFLVSILFVGSVSTQLCAQEDGLEKALITKLESTTYHALLIGIDDYGDESGIGDLMNPVSDAKKFASLLTRKYHFDSKDIKLLTNSNRSEIIEQLELLAKRAKPEDNVVVFYAGHGKMDGGIDQGYWLPADAKISTRGNWISNDDIRDYIKKIPSRHTLLVSDACFSGSLLRSAAESREILELYNDVARRVITSGNLETVPDKSVFLKYLMEELEENEKPFISASQLYQSYRRAVIYNSPNNQMPLYGPINGAGDKGGDFIFLRGKISPTVTEEPASSIVAQAPSLGVSEAVIVYGSIVVNTEIGGKFYLDGQLVGNLNADSKTPINKVTTGRHELKIVGSETQTGVVSVNRNNPATIYFKKKEVESVSEEIIIEKPTEEDDDIYIIAEQQATYKGGMTAFYRYVRANMKYPTQAKAMSIEGKVFVEFVVNKDGSPSDVKVLKGLGSGCDEAAIKVVKSSSGWIPGKNRGRVIRQKMMLPISFKIE